MASGKSWILVAGTVETPSSLPAMAWQDSVSTRLQAQSHRRGVAVREASKVRHFVVDARLDPVAAFRESGLSDSATLLYARFFIHAIDSSGQRQFLESLATAGSPFALVALEYRTPGDQSLQKAMPPHQRRFVNPDEITSGLRLNNYDLLHQHSGRGFAIWGSEDAHVVRQIFTLRGSGKEQADEKQKLPTHRNLGMSGSID